MATSSNVSCCLIMTSYVFLFRMDACKAVITFCKLEKLVCGEWDQNKWRPSCVNRELRSVLLSPDPLSHRRRIIRYLPKSSIRPSFRFPLMSIPMITSSSTRICDSAPNCVAFHWRTSVKLFVCSVSPSCPINQPTLLAD